MQQTEARLRKLESKRGIGETKFVGYTVDCTEAELPEIKKELEAGLGENESLWLTIIIPHQGMSINDFRRKEGMTPLDIEGWDDPSPVTGAVVTKRN
ncbi:MAG: hypothetical protein RIM72_22345 [Alphaproteobacteria bacterium]